MPAIDIIGPNLPRAATPYGEAFIAHRSGCRDVARTVTRYGLRADDVWTVEAESVEDVGRSIYHCHIDEGSMTLAEAVDDIHFCPCCELATG